MPRMADARAYLRRLALKHLEEGHTQIEVARILGVGERSVRRWKAVADQPGEKALAGRSPSGRPPKLSDGQTAQVLSWLEQSSCAFGFPTQQWTAVRLAQLINQEMGIRFHPRYLNEWLSRHAITPQIPKRTPRERDDQAVRRWVRNVWPRIKKKRMPSARTSFLPMRPAY